MSWLICDWIIFGIFKLQSEILELLATTGLALADQGCIAKGLGKDSVHI
jgi:hypothetical protein